MPLWRALHGEDEQASEKGYDILIFHSEIQAEFFEMLLRGIGFYSKATLAPESEEPKYEFDDHKYYEQFIAAKWRTDESN